MADRFCPYLLAGRVCGCSQCTAVNLQGISSGDSAPDYRSQTLTIPAGADQGKDDEA